jgi:hypothetical protein
MSVRLGVDIEALERDLREAVDGEVRFDPGTLAAYSTDASNYRQVPLGVVVPRTPDAAAAAVRVAARHHAPCSPAGGRCWCPACWCSSARRAAGPARTSGTGGARSFRQRRRRDGARRALATDT